MKKYWIWFFLISFFLTGLMRMDALANPPPPFMPYGTVRLNDEFVPDGTEIRAYCGEIQFGYTQTYTYLGESFYDMEVPGDDPDTTGVKEGCSPGETVSFKVASSFADQTAEWHRGTQALNLTATKPLSEIAIEKRVNEQDADSPGLYLVEGDSLTWTYIVTNTGETDLSDVTVSDDNGTPENTDDDFQVCGPFDLAIGGSQTCDKTGTVQPGAYVNIGTAEGIPPDDEPAVTASDPAHYFGAELSTNLIKKTNATHVSFPPGVLLEVNDTVTWTYEVTNSGNVDLSDVTVVDNMGTPDNPDDDEVVCVIAVLAAGTTDDTSCVLTGSAVAGQYSNLAVVSGTPPGGLDPVGDEDVSHYFGSAPGIEMVKKANDGIYSAENPLFILVDDPITWTYELHNTGNVTLTNVTVVDDLGTPTDLSDDLTVCTGVTLEPDPDPLAYHTCTLNDIAGEGQYHNTATVTGAPPVGSNVTASDESFYFGSDPAVAIEFKVNGAFADSSPGLYVLAGSMITLDYVVTNTGNVDLTDVVVTDGTYTCTISSLPVLAEDTTCTRQITALSGQQSATASVIGAPPPPLDPENATDPMYYFGAEPSFTMEKLTNDQDVSEAPGVYVLTGSTVNWTYNLTNTGNVILTDVRVVDDNGTPAYTGDDYTVCQDITLQPYLVEGYTDTCTWSKTAVEGQYTNIAVAYGNPPPPLTEINTPDTSHYFGTTLSVSLEKATNGEDADTGTGPLIGVGELIAWTYLVTNNSNVPISFTISDNPSADIYCPTTSLAVGVNTTCTASSTAVAGQYENTATVTVTPPGGLTEFDVQDTSHYFGVTTGITLQKKTNGFDADTGAGPLIKVGETVTWTYEITNTSNVVLSAVSLVDNVEGTITCPSTTIAAGSKMTCTKADIAVEGQYENSATVTANPPTGFAQVSDSDPSHYYGSDAGVSLTKLTNDSEGVPYILVGGAVEWTYRVENVGNLSLSDMVVWDSDPLLTVTCDTSVLVNGALEPGVTMTCSASGIAIAGRYDNTGYVEGVPYGFETEKVQASDSSAYFGANPSITIEKSTNGEDADTAPGPYIPVNPGETVEYDYQISNLETDYAFTDIQVVDDRGTAEDTSDDLEVVCPQTSLEPGESMTCEGLTDAAEPGQQTSAAHVLASAWYDGNPDQLLGEVSASDPANYFGYTLGLVLTKYTNGVDVAAPPGPELSIDSTVTWSYDLENTGNVELSEISLEDDNGTPANSGDDLTIDNGKITCEDDSIPGGETITCTATGVVIEGEYSNTASVKALFDKDTVAGNQWLEDDDFSYYFGRTGYTIFIPLLLR